MARLQLADNQRDWIVENFDSPASIVEIEAQKLSQNAMIRDSKKATVKITKKINNVTLGKALSLSTTTRLCL